jgi:hypothetical protein
MCHISSVRGTLKLPYRLGNTKAVLRPVCTERIALQHGVCAVRCVALQLTQYILPQAVLHVLMCRSWSGKGLDLHVLSMLLNLVDTSLEPSKLKIYFTGVG